MLTLGIETSCDETAAAVVGLDGSLLSNTIHSQIPIHAKYGGVVPELASRNHVMAILPVIEDALSTAGVTLSDIELFAVTRGPGLIGSLMVGIETAKMLAYCHNRPLVGVHHIEGHLLSGFVDPDLAESLRFPYIGLVVSGGHTSLFAVHDLGQYECLGRTLDDAAGEAFDKVSKRIGGAYPGGPYVEHAARSGDPNRFNLPSPMLTKGGYDFSFSGLKTAVSTLVATLESAPPDEWLADVCAGTQQAIARVLVRKTVRAARQLEIPRILIAGGVACNTLLRTQMALAAETHDIEVYAPMRELCTDNAGMIAGVARLYGPSSDRFAQFDLDARASIPLG